MAGLLTCRVFSINACAVFDLQLGARRWEGRLCAPIHTISHRGLERPRIGVPTGVLEPILSDAEGQLKLLGGQKLHADFQRSDWGSHPALVKGPL